jgi:transcriptional regulator with XRE-family HTH domain
VLDGELIDKVVVCVGACRLGRPYARRRRVSAGRQPKVGKLALGRQACRGEGTAGGVADAAQRGSVLPGVEPAHGACYDTNKLVARNIRRFRQERQLSLGELARRAGLSKQTLSKIEQGTGNPTIESVGAIADALQLSVLRLVTEWGTSLFVQRSSAANWDGSDEDWAVRSMDQVYGSGYVRTLILRLRRSHRDHHRSFERGTPGTLHHLYVMSGEVRAGPLKDLVILGPGDFARFPGDTGHEVECLSAEALLHVVTTVPLVPQFTTAREV